MSSNSWLAGSSAAAPSLAVLHLLGSTTSSPAAPLHCISSSQAGGHPACLPAFQRLNRVRSTPTMQAEVTFKREYQSVSERAQSASLTLARQGTSAAATHPHPSAPPRIKASRQGRGWAPRLCLRWGRNQPRLPLPGQLVVLGSPRGGPDQQGDRGLKPSHNFPIDYSGTIILATLFHLTISGLQS